MRRTGHILLLHHSEGERLRWLADWCETGLRNAEKVVYIDVAGWGADALAGALRMRGLDITDVEKTQQFEFVGIAEALALGQADDIAGRALQHGYPAVRVSLRCDALAELVGDETCSELERRAAALCHRSPVSVLCQYDGRTTTGTAFERALDRHPDWVFESDVSLHRSGHVIAVAGSVDSLDEAVLWRSLGRMTSELSLGEPVLLDLRAVDWLTVAATRAILDGTEAYRARGGQVLLGAPDGTPGWLLTTLYGHSEAGLQVM